MPLRVEHHDRVAAVKKYTAALSFDSVGQSHKLKSHRACGQLERDMKAAPDGILKILRLSQVQERIGLSRSTIYDRMNPNSPRFDSTFPRPVKLGVSAIGWFDSAITEWLMARR